MDDRVFALRRTTPDGAGRVICLQNVTNTTVIAALPDLGRWQDILSSVTAGARHGVLSVSLAPYQVAWLKPAS
jgi:hypothetical protein